MKDYDVLALGESIVDFVPVDGTLPGKFQAMAGGAPTNVACGLAKLGVRVALLSRVGVDPLGKCILKTISACGVDAAYVQCDRERFTTVTIVMPASEDMLRYAVYRADSADGALDYTEFPADLFQHAKIIHYGSLCMASETARKTTLLAIQSAKANGMITSVDVNLRPNCWKHEREMAEQARLLVELSDIVKLTLDEARMLDLSIEEIVVKGKIAVVTDGPNGAALYAKGISIQRPALDVKVLDVTGGGDAFMSAFLFFYLHNCSVMPLAELLEHAIDFCIKASSVAIQNYGAIDSLPTLEEIHGLNI